jgi:hypothetical protein
MLSKQGYDTGQFDSDEAVVEALLGVAQQHREAQPTLELGRRYAAHSDDIDRWLAEKQGSGSGVQEAGASAASPQQPASPEAFEWKPPPYDSTWAAGLDCDDNGIWSAPASRPDLAGAAKQLNDYSRWQQKQSQEIVHRFPEMVQQAMAGQLAELRSELSKQHEKVFDERIGQRDEQAQVQKYLDENRTKLIHCDDAGNVLADPISGQPRLTPRGEAFMKHAEEARGMGLSDPLKIQSYVDRQLRADEAEGLFGTAEPATTPAANGNGQDQQAAPSSQEIARDKKGRFLSRVIRGQRQAQRGGSEPGVTDPDDLSQNPDSSLAEMLDTESRKQGLLPTTG